MTTLATNPSIPLPATPALPVYKQTIYYSATGNDSAAGTIEAPRKTPKAASATRLLLAQGCTFNTSGLFLGNLVDVAIDSYVPPTATSGQVLGKPILFGADGINLFSFSASTQRVSIENVRCNSNYSQAMTAGNYAYHAPKANFGNVKGSDITIQNVELQNLAEGICLDGVTRVLINQCVQVDPLGLPARNVMIEEATDVTITNCVMTNSVNESPLRVTGSGITRGLISGNTISQQLDAYHGRAAAKAAVTIRQGIHITFQNNTVINAPLGFTSDHTDSQIVTESQIVGGTLTGSNFDLGNGVSTLLVSGLTIINHTGSECISDSAGMGQITYENLQLAGDNCGIKFYTPSDATVSGMVWNASKVGLPAMKAAAGVSMEKVVQH